MKIQNEKLLQMMEFSNILIIFLKGNSQSLGTLILDQLTNQLTYRLVAEESKYSRNRAWRRRCPSINLLEVCQNLAIFGSRPIGAAVEALLTIIVIRQLSLSQLVLFL
jgi:hypothetical protein